MAWVKFLAGAVSIGGGSSMGREGPSVQLAGTISSNLAGLAGEAKQNRRAAAAAGAAAGLAAAFNAPLAAMAFVLEEIIGDLNSRLLGTVVLASVLGALAVHGIIGRQPAFTLTGVDTPVMGRLRHDAGRRGPGRSGGSLFSKVLTRVAFAGAGL